MHLIHGTIMTTNVAQPIIPAAVVPDRLGPFQLLLPQNNGSNNMRFGDASITSILRRLPIRVSRQSIHPWPIAET
jgi:hypothetical protein